MPHTDSIRVTTGPAGVRHFMSEAIVEYRFRNPRVSLEVLAAASSGDCLGALLRKEADLAWVTLPDPPADPIADLELRPVIALPWVLAMRPGELYSDRAWVEVPELSGLRLIRPPEHSVSGGRLAAALAGVTLAPDAGTADWDTALLLAQLGIGHAVVPRLPGSPAADGAVRLVPLRGLPPLPLGWTVRSWTALPAAARSFAETVERNSRLRVGSHG